MALSSYKDIGSVLKEFQITYIEANFMGKIAHAIAPWHFTSVNIGWVSKQRLAQVTTIANS